MRAKDIPNIGHQKVGTSQTAKTIVNQSKESRHGTSLVVQWLRLCLQAVQAGSLVEELRSHMPCGQKNQNIRQEQYCNKFKTLKMVHILKKFFKNYDVYTTWFASESPVDTCHPGVTKCFLLVINMSQ